MDKKLSDLVNGDNQVADNWDVFSQTINNGGNNYNFRQVELNISLPFLDASLHDEGGRDVFSYHYFIQTEAWFRVEHGM